MYAVFLRHISSFIFAFLLTLYFVPLIIKLALKFGVVDIPDGKLKVHKSPVPYFGGFAIYVPFIAVLSLVYPLENKALWLLLGITLLMFIGIVDDCKILRPAQKFLGQFLVVFCFLKNGFSLKTTFFSDAFNTFASGFWMLSIINAFNLVDVMDGLATLLAIVSASTFFIIALWLNEYLISLLLLPFIGALLGFFFYNKPSAKIYLGDGGSLFLGGFLAAVPLLFPWSNISFDAYYAPIVILAIPLLEVGFLVLIRTYKGLPFYYGSPHHFSIYLKNRGWAVVKVLLFTALASTALSFMALFFLFNFISFFILFILSVLFFIAWSYFVYL